MLVQTIFIFLWTLANDASVHVAKLKTLWNELNNGVDFFQKVKTDYLKFCNSYPVSISYSNQAECCRQTRNSLLCSCDDVKSGRQNMPRSTGFDVSETTTSTAEANVSQKVSRRYCHERRHWVKSRSK